MSYTTQSQQPYYKFKAFSMFYSTHHNFIAPILLSMLFSVINMFNISQATTYALANSPDIINYVGIDLDDRFIACLNNNIIRRYQQNLSSYTAYNLGQEIIKYSAHQSTQIWSLANGTSLDISSRVSFYLQISKTYGYAYDYFSSSQLSWILTTPSTIQAIFVVPASVGGDTVALIWGICNDIAFFHDKNDGFVSGQALGLPTQGAAELGISISDVAGTDHVDVQAKFLSVKSTQVQVVTLQTRMTFDHVANHFKNNVTNLIETTTYVLGTSVEYNLVQRAGDYVYMQSYVYGVRLVYYIPTDTVFNMGNIPWVETYQFYQLEGQYYIVQSDGLIKLTCILTSCEPAQTLVSLGLGQHKVAYNSTHVGMYTVGQRNIKIDQYANATTTDNTTNTTNSTNSTNSTNTTNQTSNSTTNSTTTDTAANESTSLFQSDAVTNFLNALIEMLATTASVPGARRFASPLFYFFGIFDDMFLYQFHDRQYSPTMLSLFQQINIIQYKKWSLLNYTIVLEWFSANVTQFDQVLNYQQQYTVYDYQTPDHPAVGSEALLPNSQNFFVVAVPTCIVVFLVLRSIFWALFNHPASRIFRKFYFLGFLFLLLFDGNIEQFSFYMVAEWKHIFAFTLPQKLIKVFVLFFGWVLVMGSVGLYFIGYALYKKLNHYLMDNNWNQIRGHIMLIIQFGLKNFYLGFLHSVLRELPYTYSMTILLTSEALFLLMFVVAIAFGVYKELSKIWVFVLLNLTKLLLIGTVFTGSSYPTAIQNQRVQQSLICLTVLIFCCGILVELASFLIDMFCMIQKHLFTQKQKKVGKKQKKQSQMGEGRDRKSGKNIMQGEKKEKSKSKISESGVKTDRNINCIIKSGESGIKQEFEGTQKRIKKAHMSKEKGKSKQLKLVRQESFPIAVSSTPKKLTPQKEETRERKNPMIKQQKIKKPENRYEPYAEMRGNQQVWIDPIKKLEYKRVYH